jgi:23S rRNA pseudouridine1911/1915/1917 synthase
MTLRFVLDEDQDRERVDKVVPALLRGVSRATVQRWIEEGRVLVSGERCRPRDTVRAGSVIEVEPGPPPPSTVLPDATVPFGVLHEDAHLVVVDKPAGVVVHPGRGNWEHTLVAGLLARPGFERAPFDPRDPLGPLRPGIVHRLDKNTSGVLVVAKSEVAREGLKVQLSEHTVERRYRALTVGVPAPGRIETLHARHRTARRRFTSKTDEGRRAVTSVAVDGVFGGGRAALVTCRLETGRTHQIRVHLTEQRGTPLLADELYGQTPSDPAVASVASALGRQALHAEILGFTHPVTRETLSFEAPLPPDFEAALGALRELGGG